MDRSTWDRPAIPATLAVVAVALFALLLAVGADTAAAAAVVGVLLVAATALALVGWRTVRGRELRLAAVTDALRNERADERQRLEHHARRLEEARAREHALLRRLRDSWQAEREWSRELRRQLQELHARSPGRGDVLELVLQAAIQLVNAEKGLLLTREDDDGDGDLDLVVALGFSHDPEGSALVQRLARRVLAQDEIVREDDPATPEGEGTPADGEIDGLVAVPLYLRDRFHGVIVCANRPGGFAELDDEVLLALGNQAGAALQHGRLSRELRESHRAVVRVLDEAMAARDPVLHRESLALSGLAAGLAGDLRLDEHDRDVIVIATLLRNLGYLPLAERLLRSPGPLTPDERALISLHPRLGFEILRQAPALQEAAIAVLYHHERYDGQGYPARLRVDEIPLAARVLSVLEAYGAMTHERPYRKARSSELACQELIQQAGSQFDPEIVALFVERVRRDPSPPRDELMNGILERGAIDDHVLARLRASTVDGLTLLGDHRALQRGVREAAAEATSERRFAVVLVELEELPRINEQLGFPAGDRLLQVASRRAATAATRLGATAYRASGRRMAIQVPLREGEDLGEVLQDIRSEFMAGPAVKVVASAWKPGDRGEDVVARARRALKGNAS